MGSSILRARARTLRRQPTEAEKCLWVVLRSRQFMEYKFRRQHPVGAYIADFCCLEKRLVIELDGGQHMQRVQQDQHRTLFLNQKGFQVIRFWDHEVLSNTEGVLAAVERCLIEMPSPQPSPCQGEGVTEG